LMHGACMAWPAGEVHRDSNATVISTTSSGEPWSAHRSPQSKNEWVWCETSRWHHHSPLVERQAISLGRYGARYICRRHVNTAREAGAAAHHAAINKNTKYNQLSNTHVLVPVAIETGGTWHHQAVELVQEIGRRMANITGDARESTFLFQQLSMAIQRGNVVSFQNTLQSIVFKKIIIIEFI